MPRKKVENESTAFPGRERPVVVTPETGLTKQSFKKECDINHILSRYQNSGILPHQNNRQPVYADAPNIDFREALEMGRKVDEILSEYPEEIREQIRENPEFISELAKNALEAREGVVGDQTNSTATPARRNGENADTGHTEAVATNEVRDQREKV